MNRWMLRCAWICICTWSLAGYSETPPLTPEISDHQTLEGEFVPPPPPHLPERPPPPHVQKFFQVLKEKNPEEYERLRHLRETNPAEFRAEMAEKIREHRRRHVPDRPESPDTEARAHPKPHRERLAMRPDGRPPALDRFGSPELQALEERAKDLAAAIRSREPGPEREALLKELKEVLEKAFDLRDELRRDQLRRAREELDRMEKRLDERLTRRTAIIQRRMTELTEPGADAW